MAEDERPRRAAKICLDEALRDRLTIAVKYKSDDGNRTIRGIAESHNKNHIKVFDNLTNDWIIIPNRKVLRIGVCKETYREIEEDLSHSSSPRSNKPRRRSRKPFSYGRWWKDDIVQEDTDYGYR